MNDAPQSKVVVTREQIAAAAYALWKQAGQPAAQDLAFWLQAEKQQLETSAAKPPAPPASAPAPTTPAKLSSRNSRTLF